MHSEGIGNFDSSCAATLPAQIGVEKAEARLAGKGLVDTQLLEAVRHEFLLPEKSRGQPGSNYGHQRVLSSCFFIRSIFQQLKMPKIWDIKKIKTISNSYVNRFHACRNRSTMLAKARRLSCRYQLILNDSWYCSSIVMSGWNIKSI